jgi:hypothetical protein
MPRVARLLGLTFWDWKTETLLRWTPVADRDIHMIFDDVMSTTGPFPPYTTVLMEYFSEITGEYNGIQFTSIKEPKLVGDVLVLPVDSFGWMGHLHTVPEDDPMVKVIHLFIASWRGSHPGAG